jgi:hypothetical protein
VKFTKGAAIFVLLVYIFLWVLALNGMSSLIPLLVVPVVLALLVAFGVWLNRFMGITPRRQHFEDREGVVDDVVDVAPGNADDAPDAVVPTDARADQDETGKSPE